jgi:hypothetical protein
VAEFEGAAIRSHGHAGTYRPTDVIFAARAIDKPIGIMCMGWVVNATVAGFDLG